MISSSNVATYGGLCSLASLDRKQLKEKVLQSPNFKQFLELEPCMREVIVGKGHFQVIKVHFRVNSRPGDTENVTRIF